MHAPDEMTVDAASDDIIDRIMQRMDEDSDDFPTEAERLDILRACIEDCELTTRELKAMKMRLGMDGYPPMSREEIAQALGTNVNRIRQIERKAIRKSLLCPYPRRRKKLRDNPDYMN